MKYGKWIGVLGLLLALGFRLAVADPWSVGASWREKRPSRRNLECINVESIAARSKPIHFSFINSHFSFAIFEDRVQMKNDK